MVGQTLLHYRIESKLGSGGMGVVYRARDLRLNRPIALKLLTAKAGFDSSRRERLTHEARAASALNHPNIVAIYDIGEAVVDGEHVDFMAMEYVSGKPMDRIIAGKPLKPRTALKYAIQVASAVAAAHSVGIIHRDLKPANFMVTDQGDVKVLDFGLAQLEPEATADAFALTETVHLAALGPEGGVTAGTIAYMSPEQAEGKRIDHRSDVFSFGAVLYEMLTGRQPFAGDSKLSILAKILENEPTAPHELVADLPPEVERIVLRCLAKDVRERWQSMSDLRFALIQALESLDLPRPVEPREPAPPRRRRKFPWWWAAGLAAVTVCAAGGWFIARLKPDAPPTFRRLTFRRGDISDSRFAPDGKTVIYSSEWDGAPSEIFSLAPGNRESRTLGLPPGRLMALSAQGEIAMLLSGGAEGTLARVPLAGGVPRAVIEDVSAADWSPDGSKLAVIRSINGRNRVEYPPGTVLYETTGRPPYLLRVSPKGDLAAFFDYDPAVGDFAVAVAGPGVPKRNLCTGWRGVTGIAWAPSGDEVWFTAAHVAADPWIWSVSLKGKIRQRAQVPGWLALRDIDRNGRILVQTINSRTAIAFRGARDSREKDLSWLDTSYVFDISRDAKQVLFVELSYGEGRNQAIYVRGTDGTPAVLLGFGNRPSLSPDGKQVAALHDEAGKSQVVVFSTGAGEPKTLATPGMKYDSVEWMPDGRRVFFAGSEAGRPPRSFVWDVESGQVSPMTPEGARATLVRPDGKVAVAVDGNRYMAVGLGGGEARPIGTVEPGERLVRWAADGASLFLRRPASGGRVLELVRMDAATGAKRVWKTLSLVDDTGVTVAIATVTPDGESYAFSYQRDLANLYLLEGVK